VPVVRPLEARALPLGLLADQPDDLPLDAEWKHQPRMWGHAFHPMCSYLGAFPAALAHAFIARWSRPGDVVVDPFSGRGTVPLQACAERRIGVGSDLNPLAYALTAAKVDPPSHATAALRLAELHSAWSLVGPHWLALARAASAAPGEAVAIAPFAGRHLLEPVPAVITSIFHAGTLAQLLYLRHALRPDDGVDRFLAAATVGILHGRSVGYLSTSMPNAFSLAPGYTRRYLAAQGHRPPDRDLFLLLAAKLRRVFRDGIPAVRGLALQADARHAGPLMRSALRSRSLPDRARLAVMSPPYLRVVRYGAYNWLRLWFLGHDPAQVDGGLTAVHRPLDHARFLKDVLVTLGDVLTDDAVVVLVLGDVLTDRGHPVRDRRSLAASAWSMAAQPAGFRLVGIGADAVMPQRKLTRIWGAEHGRATVTDRILVIAPTELGRRRALSSLATPVDWRRSAGPGRAGRATILGPDAADVSPGRPGGDGSAGVDEEPRPRPDDEPPAELRPPAAGASVRP
jgi:site-specific DNA-methyltransferase (adenine-specific)